MAALGPGLLFLSFKDEEKEEEEKETAAKRRQWVAPFSDMLEAFVLQFIDKPGVVQFLDKMVVVPAVVQRQILGGDRGVPAPQIMEFIVEMIQLLLIIIGVIVACQCPRSWVFV